MVLAVALIAFMSRNLEPAAASVVLCAIGGVKEKVTAAHRAGIKTIILPHANKRDLEEIPEHIKKDLSFHFAKEVMDVIDVAIPNLKR